EAIGQPIGDDVAGLSLLPLVRGEVEEPRIAYAEVLNRFDLNSPVLSRHKLDGLDFSATDGNKKLIFRYEHPNKSMFFDLTADPEELNNLYERTNPEVKRLRAVIDEFDPYVTEPFSNDELDEASLEALRALGYLE
ncbi:MAG: hypothetical protein HN348_35605, partial [Proteobacteria bacterium]|nr:hypothetical protein [Pseudomonadota bacterium]